MAGLTPAMQLAIATRVADLFGFDLDAQKLLELAVVGEGIKPGESVEETLQSPAVQQLLADVVKPKDSELHVPSAARCPHCNRSFILDPQRIQ